MRQRVPKIAGYHVLTPAYGRKYDTAGKAVMDFLRGKDFIHECAGTCHPDANPYISIRNFDIGSQAELRYNHNQDFIIHEVTEEESAS